MQSDTYTGYPELERRFFDRKLRDYKPAWCLRYWYAAQGHPRWKREELIHFWMETLGVPYSSARTALRKANGLLWHCQDGQVQILSIKDLIPYYSEPDGVVRSREPLLRSLTAWHQQVVVSQVELLPVDEEGRTDPITKRELSQRSGFSVRTVRKHLKGMFPQLAQWLAAAPFEGHKTLRRLHKEHPHAFFSKAPDNETVYRRLPNRLMIPADFRRLNKPRNLVRWFRNGTFLGPLIRGKTFKLEFRDEKRERWTCWKWKPAWKLARELEFG